MENNGSPKIFSDEEVAQAVRNNLQTDNFHIVSHKFLYPDKRLGFLGEHLFLQVEVTVQTKRTLRKTLSFFVKLFPKCEGAATFAQGAGVFKKEIFMYDLFDIMRKENVDLIDSCVPRRYLKQADNFLILDDLVDQTYKTVNKHQVLQYEEVVVVLQFLSKFHACTLIYEEKISKKFNKSFRLIDRYADELEETYFNEKKEFARNVQGKIDGVVKEIELFGMPEKLESGKDFKAVLGEVCQRIYKTVKPSHKYRNVLCHGDLWATNFLLKCDNDKAVSCKFVDFQYARYCPPAQDVLSVLYLTTSREFRTKHLYNLLGLYYSNLEKCMTFFGCDLSKIVPFPDFLASCEEQRQFALVQSAIYFPLILMRMESLEKYFNNKELYRRAFIEDRTLLVRDNMDSDEIYKQRVRDSILDLKEYCDSL